MGLPHHPYGTTHTATWAGIEGISKLDKEAGKELLGPIAGLPAHGAQQRVALAGQRGDGQNARTILSSRGGDGSIANVRSAESVAEMRTIGDQG